MNKTKTKENKTREKKRVDLVISENVECLAIAIAMALILKFFLIEAYKIPSGSMQPTIVGNPDTGIYDRVLVNKFIYLLEEPERWSVIVFKFPLNRSQNYIKRLIGLPGEKVTIKNGDIYIDGEIARKPDKVLGSVMKQVFPSGKPGETLESQFIVQGEKPQFEADGVTLSAGGKAVMTGIRAKYLHGYDPGWGIPFPANLRPDEHQHVGDLQLAFEVTLDSGEGGVLAEIRENGRLHKLFLKGSGNAGPSYLETSDPATGKTNRLWSSEEIALEAGESYDVAFCNIDDRLAATLDGDEIAVHEYETRSVEMGNEPNAVTFGPVGSGGAFSDVAVHRDIYYLPEDPHVGYSEYQVPEDHYFGLGDNTQNSSDGRRWESITLGMKDGTELIGEYLRGPSMVALLSSTNRRPCSFTDDNGDIHMITRNELAGEPRIESKHFVHEKYLLGKAMAVFWPIYPHFRWKLIR